MRHAVNLLGERKFRRWVAIVALVMMGSHKPPELIRITLTRAYFCEELARPLRLSTHSSDLFLMELLSTPDALLDRPMAQVLSELSLSPEIRSALDGGGRIFDHVYQTLVSYESAEWARLSEIARKGGYAEEQIPECYLAASKRAISVSS